MWNAERRARYGPWAVVAGASEGIGAAFATQLASEQIHLFLIARRKDPLDSLAGELRGRFGVEVRTLPRDLGAPGLLEEMTALTSELDVGLLVYNAALSPIGSFLDASLEEQLHTLDVNCRAPLVLAHSLGRRLRARGRGGLLLMSSLAGLQGSALITGYGASRAYNFALAQGLWSELRADGIDVLVCAPGATRTPSFLASKPRRGLLDAPIMQPGTVAAEALRALGRQPTLFPGLANRLSAALLTRVLPRRLAIELMSSFTRKMYGDRPEG